MKTFDIDENKTNLEDIVNQINSTNNTDDINIDDEDNQDYYSDISDISEDVDEIDLKNISDPVGKSKEIKALITEIEEQRVAYNELDSKYMRTMADFENFRRRSREEANLKIKKGKIGLIKELLLLQDSFNRALKYSEENQSFENLLEGVNMLSKMLESILSKEDVRPIAAVGEAFNPEFHDCILVINNPELPNETIVEEIEPGFVIGNTVIRAAKVIVSSNS